MADDPRGTITRLLNAARADEATALPRLVDRAYAEIRTLARAAHRADIAGRDPLIQSTVLAHDVLMKLLDQRARARNSGEFYSLAYHLMCLRLTDAARTRNALKRGGDWTRNGAEPDDLEAPAPPDHPDDARSNKLFRALSALNTANPRRAEVVVLHAACGMSLPKVAELIETSLSTVERDWSIGKAWLTTRLTDL